MPPVNSKFLSKIPSINFKRPMAAMVIGNSMLSTIAGVSAAGATPTDTLMTPILDGKLIVNGLNNAQNSDSKGNDPSASAPVSPFGCVSPAVVTRAVLELCGISPVVVNAGVVNKPDFVCTDIYGEPAKDPRSNDALKDPQTLYMRGKEIGQFWAKYSDLLILGESVPGGTTTALCVMRALGYSVKVSSSFPNAPVSLKEEICRDVLKRMKSHGIKIGLALNTEKSIELSDAKTRRDNAFEIMRYAGDPMMPTVAGIVSGFCENNNANKGNDQNGTHTVILSGGTQMLAVCALIKALGENMPPFVTTKYVRDDKSASIEEGVIEVGADVIYVDPHFESIGIPSLARYCNGEVKEGTIFGGSILLAILMGYSESEITAAIQKFMGYPN